MILKKIINPIIKPVIKICKCEEEIYRILKELNKKIIPLSMVKDDNKKKIVESIKERCD